MSIMWFVLQSFYFMMPAYFANMAPVIVKKRFKKLAIPIDMGTNIFGSNKTFRGLIFGILFAIIIAYFQFLLYSFGFFKNLSFVSYSNWFILGFFLGFGALFGDMIESFVKRKLNLEPGARFIPWDQLDFVVGALIFASILVEVTFKMAFFIAVISVIGHILVNHAAYYLKIRKEKW